MNLINIEVGDCDLVTMDLRLKQIRYLKDFKERGEICFMDLSNSDVEGYTFLFTEDKDLFFKTLREDLREFLNIEVGNDLKIKGDDVNGN